MKKLILLTIILFAGLSVFAQETMIDKAEFDNVMGQSTRNLMNKPHRTIEETESQSMGNVMKTKIITERNGMAFRTIFESDSVSNYSKTESIFINGKRFVKNLNNPWQEQVQQTNYTPSTDWEVLKDEKTYKSLGEKNLDNKTVKAYQMTWIRHTVKKDNGFKSESNDVTTYYVNDEGIMFQSESIVETVNQGKNKEDSAQVSKPFKSSVKRTKKVQIDPNIKIEAPQIG